MKNNTKSLLAIIFDLLFLLIVVYVPTIFRGESIYFNTYYILLFIIWILLSMVYGKYNIANKNIKNELLAIILNAITVWGLISLYVITLEKYNKIYHLLYKQILIVMCIELLLRITYYLINKNKYVNEKISYINYVGIRNKKWSLMLIDLLSVFISFMIVVWIKPATVRIYIPNYYWFLLLMLAWEFVINLVTQKHVLAGKGSFKQHIVPIIRVNLITIILLAITIYIFRLFNLSRLIVFGTVILSTMFEIIFVSYVWIHSKIRRNMDQSERILGVTHLDINGQQHDNYLIKQLEDIKDQSLSVQQSFKEGQYNCCTATINKLSENVNLKGLYQSRTLVIDTKTLFNIETLKNNSLQLFINRHKFNDFKRLNDYFRLVNTKMEMGGYIIGSGETIDSIYEKYMTQYSKPIGIFLYGLHFIFKRVFPKLPLTREIDYLFSRGQNRTISKTEILGRLVYCGFKVVDTFKHDNKYYFIAAKINTPFEKGNPSYGPFISLKRVGKDGEIIKIYKFRTMHPYSEYIQDYVFEQNHLEKGGKIKNDFRITGWGKIFRKLWIDELPQFINFIRGDIKLVGVRALSPHYFSLYPNEFRSYRLNFKPGILPPFYVDMPETMEEIVRSEKKYLDAYSKYKILVDIKYFCIIFYNIIFRGKRSS